MHFNIILSQLLQSFLVLAETQSVLKDGASSTPLNHQFDDLADSLLRELHVPGLAVAVLEGNKTFAKGYGFADFGESRRISPSTLFYTGGTTKAFTAGAMSLLVDDISSEYAHVKWTTPISQLVPDDFVLQDSYATEHVTIEDALSHRSGMPDHAFSQCTSNTSARNVVRNMRHLPLTRELRTTFQYSNIMYMAVSHVIETLTGLWLGDFLKQRIWKPLEMHSTFLSLEDCLNADYGRDPEVGLAHGYRWDVGTRAFVDVP
ncbi:hypothetical protein MMC17_008944 [Xylographa soralifera]|nr:hypothetical protein [Xylographa soralifera]